MNYLNKPLSHLKNTIFEGNYIQKSQCVFALIALATAFFSILLSIALLIIDPDTAGMNRERYIELLEICSVCSLYSLILCMAGNFITKRHARIYTHICLLSYVTANSIILFYIGTYSIGTGIAVAGAPILSLIIYDKRLTFQTLLSSAIIFGVITALIQMSKVQYAPIMLTAPSAYQDPIWLTTMLVFVIGHLSLIIFIANTSINRWKAREAEATRLSTTDSLTGLANRRRLMDNYRQEFLVAIRKQQTLSIFLVDLDHFKHINDQYGHLSGDEALKKAAQLLKGSLRETDWVGRYGGEEFLVILPDTSGQEAIQIADRFRRQLEMERMELDHQTVSITASIGINTGKPVKASDIDHFLAEADQALYQAKHNGRNQISIAYRAEVASADS